MRQLNAAGRILALDRPRIMGVLNLTPDSFSDGGQLLLRGQVDLGALEARAAHMLAEGADILDIGGESSRPGAQAVSAVEELRRVMPALERLARFDTIISVDTCKSAVAREAIAGGCHMINDIRAGADCAMRDVVADSGVALCLMHMQGNPQSMQKTPSYDAVVEEVAGFLQAQVDLCLACGIGRERLLVDPGFGFGKNLAHNLTLLGQLHLLSRLPVPLLVGLSRKRMLGALTGRTAPTARLAAGIAAATLAMAQGAAIVRTHDVAATVDAARVVAAVSGLPDGERREAMFNIRNGEH